MRKIITILTVLLGITTNMKAQDIPLEGSVYFLPKTAMRFTVKVEKTTKKPGEFAAYAKRYLKLNDACQEETTVNKMLEISMKTFGVPDTSKYFVAKMDGKTSIESLALDDNGVLTAVNEPVEKTLNPIPFRPKTKPTPLNPRDYMNEEILSAGSSVKMAELCAQEIMDIRESRNMLTRGQADFMPKDGEQLRLMLQKLDLQEKALLQLFEGTTETDTTEVNFEFIPEKNVKENVLFRFSRKFGMVDKDDLAGEPYYVNVKDLNMLATMTSMQVGKKRSNVDVGLYSVLPGKIAVSILYEGNSIIDYEIYAAQFGRLEALDANLFSKRYKTTVKLNPATGGIERIETNTRK